ncbi:MAG: proteasome subunit beta [Desulfurococcaceae archaeon]
MLKSESKTTTVGLVTDKYVVLASDKRATAGSSVYHKAVKKIMKIDDRIAITISGLVADAQFLVEEARFIAKTYRFEHGKPISTETISKYLSLILSYFLRRAPFIVQLLVGGVDHSGPKLYYLDLYGTISSEKYMATGSGSPIAFGVLEENYRENMDLEEAKNLAFRAVSTALSRDGFSGEGVDIAVIGPEGYFEESRMIKLMVR